MSLSRTALRLVVIEAIKGATMAGARVFDSRMDDLSPDAFAGDELPTAIVFTDQDSGDALSKQNGGPPFNRHTELTIELGLTQRVRTEAEEGVDPQYLILYPNTDARLEAALDLFEFQVLRRLQYSDDALPATFRRFWRITKYECHRQVFDESGVKIACRLLTLVCNGGDDRVQIYNQGQAIPTGYAALPEPLRSVANALPGGTYGRDVCDAIAAAIGTLSLPQLSGLDTTFDGGNTTQGDVPSTEEHGTIDVATYP